MSRSLEQNNVHFQAAREKLEKWAADLVLSAEKALADSKEQIKAPRRQAGQAVMLESNGRSRDPLPRPDGASSRRTRKAEEHAALPSQLRSCGPIGRSRPLQAAVAKGFIWTAANLAIRRSRGLHLAAVNADAVHPRFAVSALAEALADAPVVLIHGPRQSGKTTLAQGIAEPKG